MLKFFCISTLYICVYLNFGVVWLFWCGFEYCLSLLISCHVLTLQMTYYYDFVDGTNLHTLNLASTSWVLYSQANELVSSVGACLGITTNNIIEHHVMIGLLTEASSHDINHLVLFLDSQLVVSSLNHVYTILNPVIILLFWRVHLLESSFESITYQHIPRSYNSIVDSLFNYMLNWDISHFLYIDE